jgi:hypothetical protein
LPAPCARTRSRGATYLPAVLARQRAAAERQEALQRPPPTGGLIVRVLDTGNYYVARANALEDNVRLYKVVDGDREQFAGVDTEVKQGAVADPWA